MDGMTGKMYKSIWKAIPDFLMVLYEKYVGDRYLLAVWKEARVVLLLKSPDKIRSDF